MQIVYHYYSVLPLEWTGIIQLSKRLYLLLVNWISFCVNWRTDLLHLSDQPFAELCQVDLSDLSHELHQAKRLLERMTDGDRPTTLVGFVSHIEQFKAAFAELYRLGVIAICLPVSTASCERSFSALRHVMGKKLHVQWETNSVGILAIERERAQSLDNDNWQGYWCFCFCAQKQMY